MLRTGWLSVMVMAGTVACGSMDPCGNEILAVSASPDGRHKAFLFQRDCGATTGFSTQVSILGAGEELRERPAWHSSTKAGNLFVVDEGEARPNGWRGGGPWVGVEWSGPNSLVVRYDAKARTFAQRANLDGIGVRYAAVSPPRYIDDARQVERGAEPGEHRAAGRSGARR